MEVIQHHETFKLVENQLRFKCVKGIVRIEGVLHVAEWDDRHNVPSKPEQVQLLQQLRTEDRGPLIRPDWTMSPRNDDYYIKKPDLYAYYSVTDLEGQIAREVELCELLKEHPHPNVATYFGCTAARGRVTGICFKRYKISLFEHVNPRFLNKKAFLESGREHVDGHIKEAMKGLLSGIRHLHSLGIVHNDISPTNVVIDEDGSLVLIDFDSWRRRGEALTIDGIGTKRTYGWYNPEVTEASEQNDLDAYHELETWLFGDSSDEYLFK